MPNSQKPPKAEERKMDWELTAVSHGSHDDSHDSHDDSHDSHDSLARSLSRPVVEAGPSLNSFKSALKRVLNIH